jgi:hypothetical protein
MSKPTTVYIITSGSYSSYEINRVYLNRADAEAFIAAHDRRDALIKEHNRYPVQHDYTIEEWEVGGATPNERAMWNVWFWPNGSVKETVLQDLDRNDYDNTNTIYYQHDGAVSVTVEAPDAAHAIKIAAELRAQHLATRYGMT